jgi:hypothetical protein
MARAAYSNRVNHDPPITLYCPPSLAECRAAYISKTPITLATVDCVAETENTLFVRSFNGNEYGRQKATFRTFHSPSAAIETAIADLLQGLKKEMDTIHDIINYINDTREADGSQ